MILGAPTILYGYDLGRDRRATPTIQLLSSLVVQECVDYLLEVFMFLLKLALRQLAFRDSARSHSLARPCAFDPAS